MAYIKRPTKKCETEDFDNDNRFGAEVFTKEDVDVLEDIEMLGWIFQYKDAPFLDINEFKKLYDLLEKGYRLGSYQKRRLKNAHLFVMKHHEQVTNIMLEMVKCSEETEDSEKNLGDPNPFDAFDPNQTVSVIHDDQAKRYLLREKQ